MKAAPSALHRLPPIRRPPHSAQQSFACARRADKGDRPPTPRLSYRTRSMTMTERQSPPDASEAPPGLQAVGANGTRLWGLTAEERLRRIARAQGLGEAPLIVN